MDTRKQAAASVSGYAGIVLAPFRYSGTQQLGGSISHSPIISGAMFAGSLSAQTVNLVLKRTLLLCPTSSMGRSEGFLTASCRMCAAVTHLEACVPKDSDQFTSNYCYKNLSNHRNKNSYRLIKIYNRYILWLQKKSLMIILFFLLPK